MTSSASPADPPVVTRDFLLLVTGHFLQALGWASALLLPLYLEHVGASRTQIGAIMASSAVGGLAFRPAVGWSLDTLGRKPTLVAGTIILVVSMGLVYFVRDPGLMAYAQRVIFGIGVGTLFTGYFTFASDLVPHQRRTEGIALFGISGLVPLVVNPFADQLGVEPAQLRYFMPALGAVILLSLLALRPIPEPPRPPSFEPVRLGPVIRALRQAPLRSVWVATIIFSGMLATFMAFVTVIAEGRGVGAPAMIWLTYALGAVAVRALGGRLPDRIGPANLVAPALGLYTLAVLVAAAADTQQGFLVSGLLAGVGHGYCFPVLTSQVVSRAPEHLRGTGLAMFTALWEVSALALTPLFGGLADTFDDATMLSLLACLALASLVVWVILEHRHGPPSPKEPGGGAD